MAEFILMVWLLQPSAPGMDEPRFLVMTSFSAGPFNEGGCQNAVATLDRMGKAAGVAVLSACVPKSVAKTEVVPKKKPAAPSEGAKS